MNWNELNSCEVMRIDPTSHLNLAEYLHSEDVAWVVIWEGQPGFYGPDGKLDPDGLYEEDPEYGPKRLVDEVEFQADDLAFALARGRRDDSSTGRGDSTWNQFRLNDAEWIDLTGTDLYAS